jgi:hypothetical protein
MDRHTLSGSLLSVSLGLIAPASVSVPYSFHLVIDYGSIWGLTWYGYSAIVINVSVDNLSRATQRVLPLYWNSLGYIQEFLIASCPDLVKGGATKTTQSRRSRHIDILMIA